MILLDMDGVITDFVGHAYTQGYYKEYSDEAYPHGVPDATVALETTHVAFKNVIDDLGVSFWSDMPLYHWSHKLIRELRKVDEVVIVTDPSYFKWAQVGKDKWLQKYGYGDMKVVYTKHKELLAHKRRLLIDDRLRNIRRFRQEGGRTWLFPRPWNGNFTPDDIVEITMERVAKFIEVNKIPKPQPLHKQYA